MYEEKRQDSIYASLIDQAEAALDFSYSPYSNYQVGAALKDVEGRVWTGCNIESASYSPTNCGERTALFKAVSEGVQEFTAIAVVGRHAGEEKLADKYSYPCGVCRQMLAEFADQDFKIILANGQDQVEVWTMAELLPQSFTKKSME